MDLIWYTHPNVIRRTIEKRFDKLANELVDEFGLSRSAVKTIKDALKPALDNLISGLNDVRNGRNANLTGLKKEVQQWYTTKYPTDELGEEIDGYLTFEDVLDALDNGVDVY